MPSENSSIRGQEVPDKPPSEREPWWEYVVVRENDSFSQWDFDTRHEAIGFAVRLRRMGWSVEVIHRQTTGMIFWDTDEATVCDWCSYSTTIRPLVAWTFALGDEDEDGDGGAFCCEECYVRWAHEKDIAVPDGVKP